MEDFSQYVNDHARAGACAYYHYQGTHDSSLCPEAPGTCTMLSYLIGLLKIAERRAVAAEGAPQVSQTPPFRTDAYPQGTGGSGSVGGWSGGHTPGGAVYSGDYAAGGPGGAAYPSEVNGSNGG